MHKYTHTSILNATESSCLLVSYSFHPLRRGISADRHPLPSITTTIDTMVTLSNLDGASIDDHYPPPSMTTGSTPSPTATIIMSLESLKKIDLCLFLGLG